MAAWLVALPLASASVPALAAGVRGSEVLRAVDSVMPAPAKKLPDELRQLLDSSGFPDVLSPFSQTPVVATEFVGTSITSGGNGSLGTKKAETVMAENPCVKFFNAQRGYVRCTVTPDDDLEVHDWEFGGRR